MIFLRKTKVSSGAGQSAAAIAASPLPTLSVRPTRGPHCGSLSASPLPQPSPSASERTRSGGDSDAGLEKTARKVEAVYFEGPCLRHTRVCTRPHIRRCARLSSASPTRPISARGSVVQSVSPVGGPPTRARRGRGEARRVLLRAAAFPAVPRARPFPPVSRFRCFLGRSQLGPGPAGLGGNLADLGGLSCQLEQRDARGRVLVQ
ncbi:hypothetical protein H8959_007822 [Pygathrix nigripes]